MEAKNCYLKVVKTSTWRLDFLYIKHPICGVTSKIPKRALRPEYF